ncbi:hypothetical protein FNH09_23300 [Streptomyces adustus]|uniref:Uncharacterized protein n=1 Tax=Streptomyces adustus TaxID=1609272 RepID=A0A5N8VJC2_9ACTN|nr:hypothetical protein [Streptomyces adustus]MPY34065.1 hypothetical protein [Streptomyces adustus]
MTTPEIHTAPGPPAVRARGPVQRRLRAFAVPAQLALAVCLLSGVPVPGAAVLGAKLLLLVTLGAEARMWLLLRRHGLSRRDALTHLVPGPVLRFITHELRLMVSLLRWIGRRRHGVEGAEAVFPHGRDQAALMYGFAFVCVVETVALSFLLANWPVAHAVMLVVDVYTVLFVLGIHAASVTRPHVLADGALRVRQGAHLDVRVPLDRIASVRRETLFTHEKKVGELNLAIGSQTSLTLHLTEPVDAPRFLGAPHHVTVIRMHADDPKSLYDAVARAHAALPA